MCHCGRALLAIQEYLTIVHLVSDHKRNVVLEILLHFIAMHMFNKRNVVLKVLLLFLVELVLVFVVLVLQVLATS